MEPSGASASPILYNSYPKIPDRPRSHSQQSGNPPQLPPGRNHIISPAPHFSFNTITSPPTPHLHTNSLPTNINKIVASTPTYPPLIPDRCNRPEPSPTDNIPFSNFPHIPSRLGRPTTTPPRPPTQPTPTEPTLLTNSWPTIPPPRPSQNISAENSPIHSLPFEYDFPQHPPPTPPREHPELNTTAPVFRGQWNPTVPAPTATSFLPTEHLTPATAPPIHSTEFDFPSVPDHAPIIPERTPEKSSSEIEEDSDLVSKEPPPPSYGEDSDEEFDDEEILAFLESEMEREEDNMGVDSFEECKMVVQWSTGEAPPVPSRDDPSYYLSDEKATKFIEQKEEIPEAYVVIKDDPRYQRLRLKWCPDVFTGEGAVQFAKNKIDPATLPYVGILFHMNRVKDAVKGHKQVEKIAQSAAPELSTSLDAFKGAQKTRGIQETAYTGVAAACMALPVVDFIPGLSAQLMILGEVGAGVAESGIEMGLKVLISKGSGKMAAQAMTKTDAFGGFGSSKAFLLYLGLPKTDDPLYAEWEPYRLKLKTLYGCAPEDDLSKMKPKGELLKKLREEESNSGKAYQIEVPLLVLLWRAFDCWHELYWDRFVSAKDSASGKTRSVLGLRRQLTLEERRRMRDFRKLQETTSVIESESAIDSHLQILRKSRKQEIIELLTNSLLHSYHVAYLFTRKKLRSEQKKNLKWFMTMVVDYFFAHNAFFWGYVGSDDLLKAVAIWDRPNEASKISFLSMLRTSGTLKLGPNRWKKMSDILFRMEDIRKKEIRGLRCWMLHWIAVEPWCQKQGIGALLVKNTLCRHKEPIYVQLFDKEIEMIGFVKKLGFVPVAHEYSKFHLYGQPVSTVGYWYGMDSPSELRALLPAKKKNPLRLTYATIRRASSQTISRRSPVHSRPLAISHGNTILPAQNANTTTNEQLEILTLLEHLKRDLAQLPPVENGCANPDAVDLQMKIDQLQMKLQSITLNIPR